MNKNTAISTLKKATVRTVPTVTLAELNHAFYFKANVYIILAEHNERNSKRGFNVFRQSCEVLGTFEF